jgi:hypothetical protein
MISRRPPTGLLRAGGLLLILISACGGRAFTPEGELGNVDLGGQSASGAGGSTARAGESSGGSSNVAGTASEACAAPPDPGPCEAYFPVWYHEAATGLCRPFIYGGCGGNFNRYSSLHECQTSCFGQSPDYARCNARSDCVVATTGCCGVCDSASFGAHDLIAFNQKYQNQLECTIPLKLPTPGGGVACEPCAEAPDGTQKYFMPECDGGLCSVLDLRQSRYTACTTDADCRLRRGHECCESCSISELLSVRKDNDFEAFLCGGEPVACEACEPEPISALAICGEDGHCAVNYYPTLK